MGAKLRLVVAIPLGQFCGVDKETVRKHESRKSGPFAGWGGMGLWQDPRVKEESLQQRTFRLSALIKVVLLIIAAIIILMLINLN
jgi:hypothetical protein